MKKINLEDFQMKITVRTLKLKDYDQLVELQKLCFPEMLHWGKDQISSQLKIFPKGQLCIEYKGKIIASSSSLIVDFDIYTDKYSFGTSESTIHPKADKYVYLVFSRRNAFT